MRYEDIWLSVRLHSVNDFLQLDLVQDLEALLLRDLCQLDVVMVEFLLHHLLQYSEYKYLCLLQRHLLQGLREIVRFRREMISAYFVPLILQLALRRL